MSFVFIPKSGKQARENREHKIRVAEREQQRKEAAERMAQEMVFWARPENRDARRREAAEESRLAREKWQLRNQKIAYLNLWYLQVVTVKFPCFGCKVTYRNRDTFLCRLPYQGKEIYFCEECLLVDLVGSSLTAGEINDVLAPHRKWLNGF